VAREYPRLLASSGSLSIILDTQYVNRPAAPSTATAFLRGKHLGGEKEKWANEHADARVPIDFHFRSPVN
jgi:hypothetical protein